MHKISVLTVTQYKRKYSFRLLIKMIEEQTMKPTEWVIVEGSNSIKQSQLNKQCIILAIKDLSKKMPDLKIVYIPYKKSHKRCFAEMLNIGNESCTGDFIVQMEDDDYYPPTRIEHAITKLLENPTNEIAGCSSIICYYLKNKEAFKSPFFHNNHACNHSLAYRKSYLNKNRYHNKKNSFSIEPTFLNEFTNPMVQLDPIQTIINIWHSTNTINREKIYQGWKNTNAIKDTISKEDFIKLFPSTEYYINKYENIHNMNHTIHK